MSVQCVVHLEGSRIAEQSNEAHLSNHLLELEIKSDIAILLREWYFIDMIRQVMIFLLHYFSLRNLDAA